MTTTIVMKHFFVHEYFNKDKNFMFTLGNHKLNFFYSHDQSYFDSIFPTNYRNNKLLYLAITWHRYFVEILGIIQIADI